MKSLPILFLLLFLTVEGMGQDTAKVSFGVTVPTYWQPKYLYFGNAMKISLDSGTIYFFKDVDSTVNAFAHFVAEHYSAYCDSLRRENADQTARVHRLQKAIHELNQKNNAK